MSSLCTGSNPPKGWIQETHRALVTDQDREKAKNVLANVVHYRQGCTNERDDIETIARAIAAERTLLG